MDGSRSVEEAQAWDALDGYSIEREIGRGATGTVWAARELASGAPVAVKIWRRASTGDPAAHRRFVREVASAGALRHPHSVAVVGHGQTRDGQDYLVMERIGGRSLAEIIRDSGPLPVVRAIHIVAQVLDAIAAGHRLGILHRDLKPSNIMLVAEASSDVVAKPPSDFVKVCDFGLAKTALGTDSAEEGPGASHTATTGVGELCGTPEYMAPEQARGEALDARADLYAVCVTLFELVVGRRPFLGKSSLAVISQHLSSPPPRALELRPDLEIPGALDSLLLRGLAKDRRERPSSAEGLRADLLQIARDIERAAQRGAARVRAREATTLPDGHANKRSRRLAASVAGAVALLLAAVAAFEWVGPGSPARSAPTPPTARSAPLAPRTLVAPVVAPTESPAAVAAVARSSIADRAGRPTSLSDRRSRRAKGPAAPIATLRPIAPAPSPAAPLPEVPPSPRPMSMTAGPLAAGLPEPTATLREAEDLLLRNEVARACERGEDVVARAPELPSARAFLGRCYMRMGLPEKGRASYRVYLRLRPEASDARFVKAIIGLEPN